MLYFNTNVGATLDWENIVFVLVGLCVPDPNLLRTASDFGVLPDKVPAR